MAQMKAVLKGSSKTMVNAHKWATIKCHAHAWIKKQNSRGGFGEFGVAPRLQIKSLVVGKCLLVHSFCMPLTLPGPDFGLLAC